MDHPLVEKILRDGASSVDVSKLSPQLRLRLMTDAGERLLHAGNAAQAAQCYALAGNGTKLRETGEWFLERRDFGAAAHFLAHVASRDELERLAQQCAGIEGDLREARRREDGAVPRRELGEVSGRFRPSTIFINPCRISSATSDQLPREESHD